MVRWLLEHGEGDNSLFLRQLANARVTGFCGCGCASIDFSVSGRRPKTFGMRVLADYQWCDEEGHLFGAFVFEQDELLAGLELWSIDGQCTPTTMPPLTRLTPLGASQG